MTLVCAYRGKVSVELVKTSSPRSDATPEGPNPLLQCRLCLPEERIDSRRARSTAMVQTFACPGQFLIQKMFLKKVGKQYSLDNKQRKKITFLLFDKKDETCYIE